LCARNGLGGAQSLVSENYLVEYKHRRGAEAGARKHLRRASERPGSNAQPWARARVSGYAVRVFPDKSAGNCGWSARQNRPKFCVDEARSGEAEMSTLFRAENTHIKDERAPAGVVAGQVDGVSLYLTNEVFLYRVAGVADDGTGELVEIEDCYSLDVVLVSIADLRARGLRVVTPARAGR
jgi:hypothetical protein